VYDAAHEVAERFIADPELLEEAVEYAALCERAAALGIPTSLDDPASPRTVEGLRDAIAAAEKPGA
jgi:hypothetical protein